MVRHSFPHGWVSRLALVVLFTWVAAGCQTTTVDLDTGQKGDVYFGCLLGNYIMLNPDGKKDPESVIRKSVAACRSEARKYAFDLMKDGGVDPRHWKWNAGNIVIPDLEKTAKSTLHSMVRRGSSRG